MDNLTRLSKQNELLAKLDALLEVQLHIQTEINRLQKELNALEEL